MKVEEKIRTLLESLGENYMFEDWSVANVRIDRFPLPCVLNVLPVSGTLEVSNTQLRDKPSMMIAFMDKVSFDASGDQRSEVVERCKDRAKAFILTLNKSDLFYPVEGEIRYSVFYDKLNVSVAGVMIEFTPRERKGIVICPGRTVNEIVYGKREG